MVYFSCVRTLPDRPILNDEVSAMKIRYLGTGAAEGVPALFCECAHCAYARRVLGREVRTRSGSIIDGVLKLDFGPDSYKQMLDNGLDYTLLRSVLITHAHDDHFAFNDLAYRRAGFAQLSEDIHPLTVYGNAAVGRQLEPFLCKTLQFRQLHPFQTVEIDGYAVTPLEAVHCISKDSGEFPVVYDGKTYFRSEEALFYLIEKGGESILYAHDTSEFTPSDMDFLAGRHIDLISLDCTNGSWNCDYVGHMGAANNLRMRERLLANGAADERTIFVANHFSHNGLVPYDELCALLPGFIVTYDSLEIDTSFQKV